MPGKLKRAPSTSSKHAKRSAANKMSSRNLWKSEADRDLKTLIKQNTPTRAIGLKLKRTEASVRQHVSKLGWSLKPTNRAPYG